MVNELDTPLNFATEDYHEPVRIRNAVLVDGHVSFAAQSELAHDSVTAHAHHVRVASKRFGGEFGMDGGKRATKYAQTVCKGLHHAKEYCPCRQLTPEEIEALYDT